MKEILSTERLILSEFSPADWEFISELVNTPEWLKNIGDRNVHNEEEAKIYLKKLTDYYEETGFGFYKVALKDNQTPIGMCGLVKRDYLDFPDIGFALLPKFMGKGYAFEISEAMKKYADTTLGIQQLFAIVVPDNTLSINLLEKLGLSFLKEIMTPNDEELLHLYQLDFKT